MPKKRVHRHHGHKPPKPGRAGESFKESPAPQQPEYSEPPVDGAHLVKGLRNRGNSCFFSALLQFLASCDALQARDVLASLAAASPLGAAFADAMRSINSLSPDAQTYNPLALLRNLAKHNRSMDGHTQQDSHEALLLLLDHLATATRRSSDSTSCKTEDEEKSSHSSDTCLPDGTACQTVPARGPAGGAGSRLGGREAQPYSFKDLFEGRLCSTVTCSNCRHTSPTEDPVWVLSLPVAEDPSLGLPSDPFASSELEADAPARPMVRSGSDQAARSGGKRGKERDKDKARDKDGRKKGSSKKSLDLRKTRAERRRREEEELSSDDNQKALDSDRERSASLGGGVTFAPSVPESSGPDTEPASLPALLPGSQPAPLSGARSASAISAATIGSSVLAPSMSLGSLDVPLGSMDLKASMAKRHGWSAPWLPGLWMQPDGARFGNTWRGASLELCLQLFFEREDGVQWKCPVATESVAQLAAEARRGRPQRLSIADRARRERLHYVPGRIEAFYRSVPPPETWPAYADGNQTFERRWTDPFDPDVAKIVQVAMVSERDWYNNQHESDTDTLNDPDYIESLSEEVGLFELTLNDEHNHSWVETHQLLVPPVRILNAGDLPRLSKLVKKRAALSEGGYEEAVAIVTDIAMQAYSLLSLAIDALTETGIDGLGTLLSRPVRVLDNDDDDDEEDEAEGSEVARKQGNSGPAFTYVGSVAPDDEGRGCDINVHDVRARFVDNTRFAGAPEDAWAWPAPDDADSDGSESPDGGDMDAEYRVLGSDDLDPSGSGSASYSDAEAVAPSLHEWHVAAETLSVASGTPGSEGAPEAPRTPRASDAKVPTAALAKDGQGLKRVESWMNDKFTAMPTRTQFPGPSELNHMLVADEGEASAGASVAASSVDGSSTGGPDLAAASVNSVSSVTPAATPTPASSLDGSPRATLADAADDVEGLFDAAIQQHLAESREGSMNAGDEAAASDTAREGSGEARTDVTSSHADEIGAHCMEDGRASRRNGAQLNGVTHAHDTSHSCSGDLSAPKKEPSQESTAAASHDVDASDFDEAARLPLHSALSTKECLLSDSRAAQRGILKQSRAVVLDPTRAAVKQLQMKELPPVLLVHLNRFRKTAVSTRKDNTVVGFPIHMFVHPDVARQPAARIDHTEMNDLDAAASPAESARSRPRVATDAVLDGASDATIAEGSSAARQCWASGATSAVPIPCRGRHGVCADGCGLAERPLGRSPSEAKAHAVRYRLKAVVEHIGRTAREGHYVAYVWRSTVVLQHAMRAAGAVNKDAVDADAEDTERCQGDCEAVEDADALSEHDRYAALMRQESIDDTGVWLRCDDEKVSFVPWQEVVCKQAYLLLYEQTDSLPS